MYPSFFLEILFYRFFKRVIDIVFSLLVLIIFSPVLIAVYVWLRVSNKGAGAFFFQERPGKNCKLFKVIKFKTMTDERDADGNLLPDTQRLTRAGRIVRASSLDELPQLINVLRGEMSLLGPRPLLPEYLPLYSPEQMRRHEVKPGISGWAQCHGRNTLTWTKKFEYDVWYVDHLSFLVDVKIVLITLKKVFARDGIDQEGTPSGYMMEPFNGHN